MLLWMPNLNVTFSKAVTASEGAFSLSCSYSTAHTVTVLTEDNISFTIDPDVNFTATETCTATVESTLVTDGSAQQMTSDHNWSFTIYNDPTAITPIAVARAAGVGWTGTIQGNVTVVPGLFSGSTSSFAIQDSTGGLYIYPAYSYPVPALQLGDVVKVNGTIKNFYGLLEMDPVTLVEWVSSGTVPSPLVTAANAVAATQGKLIQIQGTATFSTTPTVPGTDYTFSIADGTGSVSVFRYNATDIDLSGFTSGQQLRIIGLSSNHNGAQVQPRYQSDIIDLSAPTVLSTVPASGATGVNPHKPVSATFSKPMDPDDMNTTNFTLTRDEGAVAVNGAVSYDEDTHTAVFTPTAHLDAQKAYTANLSGSIQDSYEISMGTDYHWHFTTGDLDTTAPSIETRSPLPDAENVTASALVVVKFSEDMAPGSLDFDHFVLTGPYGVVPASFDYDPVTFTVTLTPEVSLLYSTTYTMTVTASTSDYAGLTLGADDVWSFTTMEEPPMQTYFGDLHNHTSYSDGSGTPSEALTKGEAAGFDFMAISDHSYAIDDSEWENTLAAVEAATDADFVALRGFEYTQGAEGHINVWNSERHAVRTDTTGTCSYCDYTPNLEAGVTVEGFYHWLVSDVNTSLEGGEVMQFNHPGWINFNDWVYHPETSGIARLEEVGNGNGSSYVFSEEEFIRSLDYGWKVGATNNADTHSSYWGTNTDHRTGVLMPELTKSALLEALRARRTFASEDKNFSLSMKANGSWMGSEIANTGSIQFEITGSDANSEELVTSVELITDQGTVLESDAPGTANFTWNPLITITTGVHYYYVKVTQADGDRIVTSPVWTLGSEDIAITDLTIQPSIPTTHNPSLLTVRVTNRVNAIRTVTVKLSVNDLQVGSDTEVIVPAYGDGYANFSWSPVATGAAAVVAEFEDEPSWRQPGR